MVFPRFHILSTSLGDIIRVHSCDYVISVYNQLSIFPSSKKKFIPILFSTNENLVQRIEKFPSDSLSKVGDWQI